MTDFGGVSVKEMSQGLKDAILDVLLQRSSPASGGNPLATIDDVLTLGGGGGGGGAGGKLVSQTNIKTDGAGVVTPSTAFVIVPGASVSITVPVAQSVILMAFATADEIVLADGVDVQLGLRIDGGATKIGQRNFRDTGFPVSSKREGVSIMIAENLGAGAHTIDLMFRALSGTEDAKLKNDVDHPIRVTAVWAEGLPTQAANLQSEEALKVVDQTIGFATAITPVTGLQLNFILDEAKTVLFLADLVIQQNDASGYPVEIGLKINGADTPIGGKILLAGETATEQFHLHKAVELPAGAYVVDLTVHANGVTGSVIVKADAAKPCGLTAIYTQPIFGVGSLNHQEAETAGGAGVTDDNNTDSFAVIPGTTVNLTLKSSQTVFFQGQGTARPNASNKTNSHFGVRIDGLDYPGTAPSGPTGALESKTLTVNKAIVLAPGVHTAALIHKRIVPGDDTSRIFTDAAKPARLEAVYTKPEAISSPFSQVASLNKTDGTFGSGSTGGAYVDFPGLNSVVFTPGPSGEALVFISGNGGTPVSNPGAEAVNIAVDGIDVVTGGEGDGLGAGVTIQGLAMQLHQGCGINAGGGGLAAIVRLTGLSPGPHTVKLRYAITGPFGGRYYCSPSSPFRLMVLH